MCVFCVSLLKQRPICQIILGIRSFHFILQGFCDVERKFRPFVKETTKYLNLKCTCECYVSWKPTHYSETILPIKKTIIETLGRKSSKPNQIRRGLLKFRLNQMVCSILMIKSSSFFLALFFFGATKHGFNPFFSKEQLHLRLKHGKS